MAEEKDENKVNNEVEDKVDMSQVRSTLENEFNCEGVDYFNYGDYRFVKAFERGKLPMNYRYFNVAKSGKVTEVKDKQILDYFRDKYEPTYDKEY